MRQQLGLPGFTGGGARASTPRTGGSPGASAGLARDASNAIRDLALEVDRAIRSLEARPDLHTVDVWGDVRGRETKRGLLVGRDLLLVLQAYQRAGDTWLDLPLVRQSLDRTAELLAWVRP